MYEQQMFTDTDQQLHDTFQQNMGFRHSLAIYIEKKLMDYYLGNANPRINTYSF